MKGEIFESQIKKSEYFGKNYFDKRQLLNQAMQIRIIYELNPKNMVEIGIGNGFTSDFLKKSGLDVVTIDINPNLNPDICCGISEIPEKYCIKQFDLVVCCEVLEHMPFEQFENNIKVLNRLGGRLLLTLPIYQRSFGISGILKLPLINVINFGLQICFKSFVDLSKTEHFWEINSEQRTRLKGIVKILKKYYKNVRCKKMLFLPYNVYFIADQ